MDETSCLVGLKTRTTPRRQALDHEQQAVGHDYVGAHKRNMFLKYCTVSALLATANVLSKYKCYATYVVLCSVQPDRSLSV